MDTNKQTIDINGLSLPFITLDTAIIGSGCAGFNAADWLYTFGRKNIAVITEGVNMGTSRNTGSDKQTYYKLSLAGNGQDSVWDMASDLFAGGGVNGDTALAEAAGSIRSFIKLCNLGVPFPTNSYGEYVGYKTDHDPRERATSAGPLTSKMMTECLEKAVYDKNIPVLDGMTAIKLLVCENTVQGLLCLDRAQLDSPTHGLTVVRAGQVILATGGPAVCYLNSVYPESQTGMCGMALESGAEAVNLQEWQYGLASLKFRWNVSGTYQQVLPRYISIDENGVEREFLTEYYENPAHALDMVFLKGYQWPFDTVKIFGSSMIDILVHHETAVLGRRVFMDYRRNPSGLENGFDAIGDEARRYLGNSGALFGTPIERLNKMNAPAISLYMSNGIDLYNEPLEIGVCAQHHNGGIAVDANWQSSISGLYVAGEAAGTFGAARPGGSALNSSQAGSLRAAEHIACTADTDVRITPEFIEFVKANALTVIHDMEKAITNNNLSTVDAQRRKFSGEMSRCAGHLRDINEIKCLEDDIRTELDEFFMVASVSGCYELPSLMKNRDMLITQLAVLSAMRTSAEQYGSRGSALVIGNEGQPVLEQLPLRFIPNRPSVENTRITTIGGSGTFTSDFQIVRPLPKPDGWFENVWGEYRERTALLRDEHK